MVIRYDNGFIAGIVASDFFNPPIVMGDFDSIDFDGGGNYTQDYSSPWGFSFGSNVAFLPSGGGGGGTQGQNGKTDPSDAFVKLTGEYRSLAGAGADMYNYGKGRSDGKFGVGGGEHIGQTSAGGGGGWFGGGSGFIKAGGGGGSGFCLTENETSIPAGYGKVNFEFNEESGDMQVNELETFHTEYAEFLAVSPPDYETDVNNFSGRVEIITPFNVEPLIFEYTGGVQEFTIPVEGDYRIKCYGAQGGGMNGVTDPKYTGGRGGRTEATFHFKQGTNLYIYVGQVGRVQTGFQAFNGGGIGDGWMNGGGGASDVRWARGELDHDWMSTIGCRFIVAGGGGGTGGSNPPFDDSSIGSIIGIDNGFTSEPDKIATPEGNQIDRTGLLEPQFYLVSHHSIAEVNILYSTSARLPRGARMRVTLLEVDHTGNFTSWGAQELPLKPYTNSLQYKFTLTDFIPEELGSFWTLLTIRMEILSDVVTGQDTSIIMDIPQGGVNIRITTPVTEGEKVEPKPPLYVKRGNVKTELLTLIDTYKMQFETQDYRPTDFDRLLNFIELTDTEHHVFYKFVSYNVDTEELALVESMKFEMQTKQELPSLEKLYERYSLKEAIIIDRLEYRRINNFEELRVMDSKADIKSYEYKHLKKISKITHQDLVLFELPKEIVYDIKVTENEPYAFKEDIRLHHFEVKTLNLEKERLSTLEVLNRQQFDFKGFDSLSMDKIIYSETIKWEFD